MLINFLEKYGIVSYEFINEDVVVFYSKSFNGYNFDYYKITLEVVNGKVKETKELTQYNEDVYYN